MVEHASFWTYRAGTRVLTTDGRRIGRVAAVRRDAALITRADGESAWVDAAHIVRYDGSTLTVAPSTAIGADVDLHGTLVRADQLIAERTLLWSTPTSFDA